MKRVLALLALVGCGLWTTGAAAQARYHCRDDAGNSYSLSRPCPGDARTTAVTAGPAPSYSSYSRYDSTPVRVPSDVPEHHQYMSARCRSLDDGIRSAYSRGIKADVVAGMRNEYKRDCSEQERAAYSQLSSEHRARTKERREEEKSARLEEQVSREQEARFLQQCAESRRILQAKKARTDLTEGERNELRRFEDNFIARCKR